jgi:GTP cyclohydrolase II
MDLMSLARTSVLGGSFTSREDLMEVDTRGRCSKPYLVYAIEECVRCAQKGGVGVVVYFRKEGRALGEVTK